MNKVLIGMSGGVDSSVAAFLLQKDGFEVTGYTMKLFDNSDIGALSEKSCCSLDDAEDARSVCAAMGIPHYMFNMKDEFRKNVIDRFVSAYQNGATPNPCIDCNRYLKFGKMLERADELGIEYISTGHYAKVEKQGSRYLLKKGADEKKDQSYVLYSLTQKQLSRLVFPLGSYTKEQVREIAEQNGFVNAKKHESQDICFVPEGDYYSFIERYTDREYPNGDFVTRDGRVLGEHKGIIRYTVGQRRGLGLALPASMYVLEKDIENNRVILGFNEDLFSKEVKVKDITFTACERLESPERFKVKIRYNQKEQSALVTQTDEDRLTVIFDEPQRAATKGQAAVIYDGDTVIGGGTIE